MVTTKLWLRSGAAALRWQWFSDVAACQVVCARIKPEKSATGGSAESRFFGAQRSDKFAVRRINEKHINQCLQYEAKHLKRLVFAAEKAVTAMTLNIPDRIC